MSNAQRNLLDQIEPLRKQRKLSEVNLSLDLGWGENAYQGYNRKVRPVQMRFDKALKLLKFFGLTFVVEKENECN